MAPLDGDSGERLAKAPSGTGPPTGAAPPTVPSRVPMTLLSTGLSATFGEAAGTLAAADDMVMTAKKIRATTKI